MSVTPGDVVKDWRASDHSASSMVRRRASFRPVPLCVYDGRPPSISSSNHSRGIGIPRKLNPVSVPGRGARAKFWPRGDEACRASGIPIDGRAEGTLRIRASGDRRLFRSGSNCGAPERQRSRGDGPDDRLFVQRPHRRRHLSRSWRPRWRAPQDSGAGLQVPRVRSPLRPMPAADPVNHGEGPRPGRRVLRRVR